MGNPVLLGGVHQGGGGGGRGDGGGGGGGGGGRGEPHITTPIRQHFLVLNT